MGNTILYKYIVKREGIMDSLSKSIIENRLGVQISITPSEYPIVGKYRSEIKNGNFFVGYTSNSPNSAFERALNIWIKYDHHTPYVSLENLVVMINSLPSEPETDEFVTHVFTGEGEMTGVFTLVDNVYKLYYFCKSWEK